MFIKALAVVVATVAAGAASAASISFATTSTDSVPFDDTAPDIGSFVFSLSFVEGGFGATVPDCDSGAAIGCGRTWDVGETGTQVFDLTNDTGFAGAAAAMVSPSTASIFATVEDPMGILSGSAGQPFVPFAPGTTITSVALTVTSLTTATENFGEGSNAFTFEAVYSWDIFYDEAPTGPVGGEVPLPASLPLLAGGALALVALRRRRKA